MCDTMCDTISNTMRVIEWQQFLKSGLSLNDKYTSMTVGIFDGVHRGHQALIRRIVSHNADFIPVVVTFRQNYKTEKREKGKEEREKGEILSFSQRLESFERLGVKITVVVDFTEEFRQMPGRKFLELLLKHGCVGFFAAGSDFRCGFKLDTDAGMIKSFFTSRNIPVEIVPQVLEGSLPVSSSRIRSAIAAGDFFLAEAMLGRGEREESHTKARGHEEY